MHKGQYQVLRINILNDISKDICNFTQILYMIFYQHLKIFIALPQLESKGRKQNILC